jgi:hypothetical protein
LRRDYEARQYEVWLGSSTRHSISETLREVKLMKQETGLIINALFSILGSSVSVFFLSQYLLKDLGQVKILK